VEPGLAQVELAEPPFLALSHRIEAEVESGIFRSGAEVASALGISRARASQLMRRRWAPVAEQEHALGPQHPGESS
jgi:hypothetical protein